MHIPNTRSDCTEIDITTYETMAGHWDLKEKTFLITGAASGLGAVYSERFLKEGAKKVIILDVATEQGKELEAELNITYPEKAKFYHCDISDEAQLTEVFNEVVDKFGQIDVIINNAGIMCDTAAMWMKSIDVNVRGLVSLTLKGVKHMRKDEGGAGGTIINVASTAALLRLPFVPIYCGTKAATIQFSQCLAADPIHANNRVRILIFCLAPTHTNIMKDLKSRTWDAKAGEVLEELAATSMYTQKTESAADALVKMYKEGTNGSIWLSTHDRPSQDISKFIDAAFKSYEPLL